MTRIESLTDEQKAMLPVIREEWLSHGLNTEPADRPFAEEGMRKAYRAAGLEPPSLIIWLGSPMSGALGASILQKVVDEEKIAQPGTPEGNAKITAEVVKRVDALMKRLTAVPVDADIVREVQSTLGNSPNEAIWGQHDTGWLSYYDALRRIGVKKAEELEGLMDVAKASGWWWPFNDGVVMTERPRELHQDNLGRLHNEKGFAISYPDGWGFHVWHGTRVPRWVIYEPTPERIAAETNTEVRRCGIESLGWEKFVIQAKLKLVNEEPDPGNKPYIDPETNKEVQPMLGLYDVPREIWGDDVRVLLCTNGTTERDGTRRRFGLTVPTTMRNAVAAAAWGYDLTEKEYREAKRRC